MPLKKTIKKTIYNNYELVFVITCYPMKKLFELKCINKHSCFLSLSGTTLKENSARPLNLITAMHENCW